MSGREGPARESDDEVEPITPGDIRNLGRDVRWGMQGITSAISEVERAADILRITIAILLGILTLLAGVLVWGLL